MRSYGGFDNKAGQRYSGACGLCAKWLESKRVEFTRSPGAPKTAVVSGPSTEVAGPSSKKARLQRRAVQIEELEDIILVIRELQIERRWEQLYKPREQKRDVYEYLW